MIMVTMVRRNGHNVMNIHKFPVSGKYGFEVTSFGYNDNKNWPETFDTLKEAVKFAKSYGWKEIED